MSLITLRDVCKRFGPRSVLDEVGFSVGAGQVVGLIGPNGVGKSTTLHLLMGFLTPDRGSLSVLGAAPAKRFRLHRVGWMPESPAFPAGWRVQQVLDFHRATQPGWDEAYVQGLCERLSLDPGQRFDTLSRGGLASVSLLTALGHRPEVLLLDEPTLGLDLAARRLLLGELLGACAEDGVGILIATHLLQEIAAALDRIVFLRDASIVVDEDLDDIRQRCRRLVLPAGTPPPPAELWARRGPVGWVTSRWDEGLWREYRSSVALGARAEPVALDDLYLHWMEPEP